MSEIKIFCTDCWREVNEGDIVCPSCGSDLSAFSELTYDEKLMKALMHFEPQTAVRAAEILTMRRSRAGVEAIADAYVNRNDLDPIMARAFVTAIAAILGREETYVAIELNRRGGFHSEMAPRIVESIIKGAGNFC